jgi:hypothetical protein
MKNLILIVIITLTLIVIGDVFWWIKVATEIEGFDNAINEFLTVFPDFINSGRDATYLLLSITTGAIALSGYMISKQYHSSVSIILLSFNALIFAWSLFSLM